MTYVRGLYGDHNFLDELGRFTDEVSVYGHETSLAQTLLKLTAPGIPDFYQGTELWNFSLVDPDNRRLVDYELRKRLLHEVATLSPEAIWARRAEGLPKLWVIRQGLRLRRERPHVFGPDADYLPLYAQGEQAQHVVGFLRAGEVVAIAPRLFLQLGNAWGDTTVELPPGRWHHVLDGQSVEGGVCLLRNLLCTFPVALLSKVK
jgi:(1->4)-alpha-D-glucan 1-alpha-D-glucosylmutase